MARMQAGSVSALGQIYDRYCDRAYRIARSVDLANAEDAVQEAFISIWDSRATYRANGATAAPWLMTVVHHRAIDVARRNTRDRTHHGGDGQLERRGSPEDVPVDSESRAESRHLLTLLARLPDTQREVIVLAFYGQLTHTQIAEHLDEPLGTIKGRMRLGLEKLRAEI